MATSPVRRLIVAYAVLTGLLYLAVLLPGNPYFESASVFIFAVGIQTLIVWRLWNGSSLAWLIALAIAALTVVSLLLIAPGREVGTVLVYVFSTAQAVILLACREASREKYLGGAVLAVDHRIESQIDIERGN